LYTIYLTIIFIQCIEQIYKLSQCVLQKRDPYKAVASNRFLTKYSIDVACPVAKPRRYFHSLSQMATRPQQLNRLGY